MQELLGSKRPGTENLAAPILTALQSYSGTIVDLENSCSVDGGELAVAADALADRLAEFGLATGDRVLVAIGNGPTFTVAVCGTLAAGGTPLVLHSDTPPQELRRVAQQYAARFVLCEKRLDATSGDKWRREHLPHWLEVHCDEMPLASHGHAFPSLGGATLHPTSGTTGQAKIAVRTAQQTFEEARHYVETMQITPKDRILCLVPMSHAYGFGMGFMVSLLSGASLVTLRQFNPRTIPRILADQRISVFPAVPAMLDLIRRAGTAGLAMPRLVLAAGAPLQQGAATSFREQTGRPITPLYGTTETGGVTVAVGDEGDLPCGCVGRPMQGVEARILPITDAAELQQGVGRVEIRSSSMMSGYLTASGIDRGPIRDGWFDTGDLGRIDAHGRIQLVGREKEIINVFGLKVVPSEVEEVIIALPGVREVKVYPGAHRSGSDMVKAAVAADQNVDIAKIRSHCEASLPPFKRPQLIHLVDALPRSATGKILRAELP